MTTALEIVPLLYSPATLLSLFTFRHWRRKWHPTPVFLPGESQGRGAWWAASVGSHRGGHDWSDLAAAAAAVSRSLPSSRASTGTFLIRNVCRVHSFASPHVRAVFGYTLDVVSENHDRSDLQLRVPSSSRQDFCLPCSSPWGIRSPWPS